MSIRSLADLTWIEFRDLDRRDLVVILPVGATEAHGPHLPLSTDVVIAEAMARAGADRLSKRGLSVVVAPSVSYTVAGYAAGFAGTISMRPDTAALVYEDVARSLASHGVETMAVANAHLEPSHIRSIVEAGNRIQQQGLLRFVFPDVTKKPWALRLTDEFKSGACHAGRYEGSIVLAERPDLVRADVMAGLPPNPVSLSKAIAKGQTTFEEAGGPSAYFGHPAEATDAEGRQTVDVLGQILDEAVAEALGRRAGRS